MKQFAKLLLILTAISIQIIGCKKADNSSSDNNGGGAGSEDVRVTTYNPQNVSNTSAVCGGDVIVVQGLSLTEIGVCWNTTGNPVASENHLSTEVWNEPFVCTINGLESETQYYVRAYALRGLEYYYGDEKSFTTLSNQLTIPLITTYDVTDVTGISAVCGGIVMSDVNSTIIAKGVCWNTSENPTIDNQHTDNGSGTGEFTTTLSGLQPNTTYYIRVYATNESGTYYGLQKSFATTSFISENGLFILNEGIFSYNNASLSFFNMDNDEILNEIFWRVNGIALGDVGQSLAIIGGSLYVIVNNSKCIYKVDKQTILYQAKIEGFTSPRYMLPINDDKAYVSDLYSPGLWSLNINTYEKHFVETGNATEAMVKVGNEVFVANWSNYYSGGSNNTIQVIDCDSDMLVSNIEVAQEPCAMVVDKNNHIWVLCSGGFNPPYNPAIICIDPTTRHIIKRLDFIDGGYPTGLAIDGNGENLYYMNGSYSCLNVYKMSVDDTQLPTTPFIESNSRVFYNLNINPNNDDIYITDAKNYVQNGSLLRFSANGELIGEFELRMTPSFMLFNF